VDVSAKERSIRRTSGVAASSPSGRRALECLELLRARPPVLIDEGFGGDLLEVIEAPDERAPGVARNVE